ncbi:MAG TPA: RNA polymerase sigma factor [Ignavibacteria bacterium]|nr:RNA polymerase sigma factor [Ignavibacteria bacterium]
MEQQLINELKRGDPRALENLFSIYKDKVFNTAVSYLQNIQDAEELTQDVFIEIYNSAGKFKGDSSISTWIYRITVNKALDKLKFNKRRKRFAVITSIFKPDSAELAIDTPDFIHPGTETELKERSQLLFKALEKLPGNQKTAFILSKLESLSQKEISAIMKISVSSVESLIFRARQNLKNLLINKFDELH